MQKITLIGRLGRDAAIRETQEGNKIVSFTMAVNGRFRGTEKTSWYDVSTFNYERYRNMVKYLTKGSLAIVTGDLDADIEKGNDGVTRCRRYVTADSIEFGPSNSGGTSNDRTEESASRSSRRRVEEEEPDIDDTEMEVTRPKKRARVEEDEETKPVRKPKQKAEEYDEEEEAPRPKKRARVEEDEDEDDEPKVAKKPRKAEPEDDEERTEKKPKKRGSEDDEEELPF